MTTYPHTLEPTGNLTATDVDLLNNPSAFASQLYSDLAADYHAVVMTSESAAAVAAFDAACALVKETAATGGDVAKALDCVSDATYGMACDAHSRGMEFGVAAECFRQGLIGALTPAMGPEANNRANLETVERERAKLREKPETPAAD